jgi:hypothetical protein
MEKEVAETMEKVTKVLGDAMSTMKKSLEDITVKAGEQKNGKEIKEKKTIFIGKKEASVTLLDDGTLIIDYKDRQWGAALYKRIVEKKVKW